MLRKNQPVKFCKPVSTMKTVYLCVENGIDSRAEIVEDTGLVLSKVRAALFNLTFIGVIQRHEDDQGRSRYTTKDGRIQGASHCLRGVRSIFDVT